VMLSPRQGLLLFCSFSLILLAIAMGTNEFVIEHQTYSTTGINAVLHIGLLSFGPQVAGIYLNSQGFSNCQNIRFFGDWRCQKFRVAGSVAFALGFLGGIIALTLVFLPTLFHLTPLFGEELRRRKITFGGGLISGFCILLGVVLFSIIKPTFQDPNIYTSDNYSYGFVFVIISGTCLILSAVGYFYSTANLYDYSGSMDFGVTIEEQATSTTV